MGDEDVVKVSAEEALRRLVGRSSTNLVAPRLKIPDVASLPASDSLDSCTVPHVVSRSKIASWHQRVPKGPDW